MYVFEKDSLYLGSSFTAQVRRRRNRAMRSAARLFGCFRAPPELPSGPPLPGTVHRVFKVTNGRVEPRYVVIAEWCLCYSDVPQREFDAAGRPRGLVGGEYIHLPAHITSGHTSPYLPRSPACRL